MTFPSLQTRQPADAHPTAALPLGSVLIGLGIHLTVPLVAVLNGYVIRKEERYLERKFDEDYRTYRERVRQWV